MPLPPMLMAVLAIITQGAALWLAYKAGQKSSSGLASQDELTGLRNRRALYRLLKAHRRGHWVLLMLDLNGFKPVNDEHGHEAGDELLKVIAQRLRAAVLRGSVYRLGGDEFVIVMGPFATLDAAEQAVFEWTTEISEAVAEPISLEDNAVVQVTASLGIAVGGLSRVLLRHADVAMYQAKELVKAGGPLPAVVLFRPGMTVPEKVTPEEQPGRRRDRRLRKR